MSSEYLSHDQLLDAVASAGHYAGHAAAMATNLHLANSPERAASWEAEHDAWQARQADLIAAGDLKRQLGEMGEASFVLGYTNTVYIELQNIID